jgi:uncharacterized membrane protein
MSYSVQALEMKLHALSERIGNVEYENKVLKQRVAELEKQKQTTEA